MTGFKNVEEVSFWFWQGANLSTPHRMLKVWNLEEQFMDFTHLQIYSEASNE